MDTKKWYESKTVWIAVIQAAMGLAIALQGVYPAAGSLLVLKSVLDILNRFLTQGPVSL